MAENAGGNTGAGDNNAGGNQGTGTNTGGGTGQGQGGGQGTGGENKQVGTGTDTGAGDKGGTPTILNKDQGGGGGQAPAPATWPDQWRTEMVKGLPETDRAKELKRLESFSSPEEVYKSNRELERMISSNKFIKPLPEKPTPEQVADYRKQNGIPETPDKYDIKLKDGLVIGEQDRPYIDQFLKNLHDQNATPSQVNAALDTYYETVQALAADRVTRFEEARDQTADVLGKEWGNEYNKNLNIIQGLMDGMPEGVGKHILEGFGADGIPLMSNPDVVRSILAWARQMNPGAGINLPGGGQVDMGTVETRLGELKKMMGDDNSEYWKGPKAAALQQEWRDLDAAYQGMKKKKA